MNIIHINDVGVILLDDQMDQDDHHAKRSRRYVPLTREQEAPVEDIEPGELNQPINVSQVLYIFSLVHIAIYNNVRFILKYRFSSFLNGINNFTVGDNGSSKIFE
jgi:hypothetical protein